MKQDINNSKNFELDTYLLLFLDFIHEKIKLIYLVTFLVQEKIICISLIIVFKI